MLSVTCVLRLPFGLKGSRDVRLAAAKRSTLHSVYIGGLCSGKEAISHWQLLSHGTPVEPRATKRAKKAASVSSTQDMAETDPINSPTATDSEASSDSDSSELCKGTNLRVGDRRASGIILLCSPGQG